MNSVSEANLPERGNVSVTKAAAVVAGSEIASHVGTQEVDVVTTMQGTRVFPRKKTV